MKYYVLCSLPPHPRRDDENNKDDNENNDDDNENYVYDENNDDNEVGDRRDDREREGLIERFHWTRRYDDKYNTYTR